MTKLEFLATLEKALAGLPKEDCKRIVDYYCEMIDDRIEEGLSEETAVKELGAVYEGEWQIIAEIPLSKLVKERIKPKRALNVWDVLLAIGSPIWLSLMIFPLYKKLKYYFFAPSRAKTAQDGARRLTKVLPSKMT